MDLNDVWQANRRFILAVGCGAVLVLVAKTVISATWDVDRERTTARALTAKLGRTESPNAAEVTRLKDRNDELEKRVNELTTRMRFKTSDKFLLPSGHEGPDLVFNRVRAQVREELVQVASQHNIQVDETLGMPDSTPSGREAIQRNLSGLDIVEQVVSYAVVGGARSVDKIEMDNSHRAKRLSTNEKGEAFLEGLQVKFLIHGSASALADVLDLLTRGDDRFLAIDELALESDDKKGSNLLALRLTVSGLSIAGAPTDAPSGARP